MQMRPFMTGALYLSIGENGRMAISAGQRFG
jgi:hypothetical protein